MKGVKTRLVQFKVTEDFFKIMKAVATKRGEITVSSFIRQAIQEKIEHDRLER